jgi:Fic family protein
VPISAERLDNAMSRWERYIHEEVPDRLVQLAILHAEFEALHPFLDGNGRLGRMFVPLFLFGTKSLQAPMFYISAYLEANRDEYYERLLAVSRDGGWTGWCRFFLKAMTVQAEENLKRTQAILDLYARKKTIIVDATHSQYSIKALDFIFANPIFRTSQFVSNSGIPERSAKRILKVLQEQGFFREIRRASGRRPAIRAFKKLLNAAEGKEVF